MSKVEEFIKLTEWYSMRGLNETLNSILSLVEELPPSIKSFVKLISPYRLFFLTKENTPFIWFSHLFFDDKIASEYEYAKNLLLIYGTEINHYLQEGFSEWTKKGIILSFSVENNEIYFKVTYNGSERKWKILNSDFSFSQVSQFGRDIDAYLLLLSVKEKVASSAVQFYLSAFRKTYDNFQVCIRKEPISVFLEKLREPTLVTEFIEYLPSISELYRKFLSFDVEDNRMLFVSSFFNNYLFYENLKRFRNKFEKVAQQTWLTDGEIMFLSFYLYSSPPKDKLYSKIVKTLFSELLRRNPNLSLHSSSFSPYSFVRLGEKLIPTFEDGLLSLLRNYSDVSKFRLNIKIEKKTKNKRENRIIL